MFQKSKPRLTGANQKHLDENRQTTENEGRREFALRMELEKQKAVQRWWFEEGPEFFIAWVKEHYRTHKGTPLKWEEPFYLEFAWAIGNPWFVRVIAIKGAQMGWTEILIALCAFSLTVIRGSAMFCVDKKEKLLDIVPPRVQPSFDAIEPIQALRESSMKMLKRKDTDTKQRLTSVGGVSVYFAFAGKAGGSGQGRQVSSSLSSVPVEVLICADEVEDFPLGAINILRERTSASEMPTCPMRFGSTPGGEGGVVDVEVKNAKHSFEWWVICPSCNEGQFLQTKGSLFKPVVVEGSSDLRYFDAVGNPLEWFNRGGATTLERIASAYLGCKHCGEEITRKQIENGEYRCEHTGRGLREVGTEAMRTRVPVRENIAIRIPRLASRLFNLQERLAQLLEARSVADRADAMQQGFGEVTSFGGGKIDKGLLLSAIAKALPPGWKEPDFVCIGADQGLGQHWAVVQHWHLGEGEDYPTRWRNASVFIPWAGPVHKFAGLIELAQTWGTDFIGIDMNPEAAAAGEFAQKYKPDRLVVPAGSKPEILEPETPVEFVHPTGKKRRANREPSPQSAISLPRSREAREKIEDNSAYFDTAGIVFLFYQTELKGEQVRRTEREVQGEKIPSIALDRTFGLDSVCDIVHQRRLYLPQGWEYNSRDRDSFLFQMLTSERGADARWREIPGAPDHFFHAMGFGAAAAYTWMFEPQPGGFAFSSVRKKKEEAYY